MFYSCRFLRGKVFTNHLSIRNLLRNITVLDFGSCLTSLMFLPVHNQIMCFQENENHQEDIMALIKIYITSRISTSGENWGSRPFNKFWKIPRHGNFVPLPQMIPSTECGVLPKQCLSPLPFFVMLIMANCYFNYKYNIKTTSIY